MRFAGQAEAKQFFVGKIVAEATAQGLTLSAAELTCSHGRNPILVSFKTLR